MDQNTTIDASNEEFSKALQILKYTNRSLFLTGKAGTGKSTFLRHICSTTKKKHVVLAPTGIAAINVGGSTLHSFFKLPFHPLLPNDVRYSERNIRETLKYTGAKCKIIREVQLIIIDEISMVRADIIDFIDKVLRYYTRNRHEPFGGKQMLFVGDIFQLEPVTKDEERQLLRPYYPSMYFFHARVFRELELVSIELTKVYRQKDTQFISILDHIRTNSISQQELYMLNTRTGQPISGNGLQITLSARRDTVDYINEQHLEQLPGEAVTLSGEITGDFPTSSLPTPLDLDIKVGAQVIFVKNDFERRWVNGTLGTVTSINLCDDENEETLCVMTDSGMEYDVTRDIWSNMRYTYNEKEQKIEEEELGRYVQFPIRLAWAITVHKSQGLTFKHVNIDLSGGAFAGGQTYVALSRCESLEGISLKEPLRMSDIFVRPEVISFSRTYNNERTIMQALEASQADQEYHDAVKALDAGDADSFLDNFFKAIHHRYDIEKPRSKRFIRMKLNQLFSLRAENQRLKEEQAQKADFLQRLAAEYTIMGKECEHEKMYDAAISNYKKALELYPEAMEPRRRIKKLEKKISSNKESNK